MDPKPRSYDISNNSSKHKQTTNSYKVIATYTTCYNELYVSEPSGHSLLLSGVHTTSVCSVTVSLSFTCFDLNCWRCHSSEVLRPNWTKFSGNAHNNNTIRCRKFGMLKMNRNVHSGKCSLMNFIARNFVGTTIRYYLTGDI